MIFLLASAAFILGQCLFEGGIYWNNYGIRKTSLLLFKPDGQCHSHSRLILAVNKPLSQLFCN